MTDETFPPLYGRPTAASEMTRYLDAAEREAGENARLRAELRVARIPHGTIVRLKRWNRLKKWVAGREGVFCGATEHASSDYVVTLHGDSFSTIVGWQDIVLPSEKSAPKRRRKA